MIEVRELA